MLNLHSALGAEKIGKESFRWIMAADTMKKCDQIFASSKEKSGNILIDIKLDEEGKVISAIPDFKKSTLKNKGLGICVSESIKGYSYPAEGSGKEKIVWAQIPFPRGQ